MKHDLKTWPEFFQAMWDGKKTFEIRKADREFEVGDTLVLREYIPAIAYAYFPTSLPEYTGREMSVLVTYILQGMGLKDGYVCMSISAQ